MLFMIFEIYIIKNLRVKGKMQHDIAEFLKNVDTENRHIRISQI